jgi:predicted XRE-type DNA-binding protein
MARGRSKGVVVQSSGNVFTDFGVANADEKQTKVRLAVAINQIIRKRHVSQTAAALLLDISQPKISALANFRLDGFSVERVMLIRTAKVLLRALLVQRR